MNGNKDLLQTGVNMVLKKAVYCLWDNPYQKCDETGNQSPTELFTVSQGDNMYGYVARTGVGVWEVLIEDTTKGGSNYYQNTFSFSPDHTTADWIVETSVSQGGTVQNFNDISFGGDD